MSVNEDAIRKGHAAKALLEGSDFNIAIDTVRLDAFKAWANSKPEENEKREQSYYLLQAIEGLKNNLAALVDNAKVEEYKLNREDTKTEITKE